MKVNRIMQINESVKFAGLLFEIFYANKNPVFVKMLIQNCIADFKSKPESVTQILSCSYSLPYLSLEHIPFISYSSVIYTNFVT